MEKEAAVRILRRAYSGGMRFFDTARAYSDSEEKLGEAFGNGFVHRNEIVIATKSHSKTPEELRKDLETSLRLLKTDYIDIYQLHNVPQCYRPGDGTGLYECMLEAKAQGKIRHIGITTHKLEVAREIIRSGFYETLQYPFSYLSTDKETAMVRECLAADMGFICMKGLAGGLITRSDAVMAFVSQYEILPIWGIQRETELDEWLSYMENTPRLVPEIQDFLEKEQRELSGEFCRGCGYCMPCTVGIQINNCNRMSLMLRRAPSRDWLSETWQANMKKIEDCIDCGKCMEKCPYELHIPELLRKNYEDYKKVLAGEISVS